MGLKTLILAGAFGVMLLGSEAGLAQSTQSQNEVLKPRSTSPFEIAKAVNRSTQIWKKRYVQIDVDLAPTWERLRISPGDFAVCAGDCEGEIFESELNGKPGKEVILKLTKSFNFCRYLIFEPVALGRIRWKLLGYIDHDFNRYQMARHRVIRAFGRNWFVLRGQEGSGSGYYLYGETWFEVVHRGVRPVLHYSVEGHTDPGLGGLKWEWKGRPFASRGPNKGRAIRLTFDVFYTAKSFENHHFTRRFIVRRHANYVWNRSSREFVFDLSHSSISEREMNAVANVESEPSQEVQGVGIAGSMFFSNLKGFVGSGFEMFIRLNVGRLLQIAKGEDHRTKDWLREFLKQCDDTSEKQVLEIALQDRLPQSSKRR